MSTQTLQQSYEEAMKQQMKLMMKKEPLLPELRRYVQDYGGELNFRHPLCLTWLVGMDRGAWINWFVRRQEKELEDLRRRNDWQGVILLYHQSFRLQAFCDHMEHFDDATYWSLLADVWVMLEQLWKKRYLLLELLRSSRPGRENMMDESERRDFARLPELLPVYRGYVGCRGNGLSWTTDKRKAIWCARRFSALGEPRLLSGTAARSDVLAYFNRRDESEVVIDPEQVGHKKIRVV